MGRNEWTSEELALLHAKYCTCGWNIPELLERHSKATIQVKASTLNIRVSLDAGMNGYDAWTPEETRLLLDNYEERGSDIPELLKNRSAESIRNKARSLGLHKRELNPTSNIKVTVYKGITYSSISSCAHSINMSEAWVREHRDSDTGVVVGEPCSDLEILHLDVVVNDVHYYTTRELCDAVGWHFTSKVRMALKEAGSEVQHLVDSCLSLGITPQSYARLAKEYSTENEISEFVHTHPLAFQDGKLIPGWKRVPEGGGVYTVVINNTTISSGSQLAKALGIKFTPTLVDFLRDGSVDHQGMVDDSISTGVSIVELYTTGRGRYSRWSVQEIEELHKAYEEKREPKLIGRSASSIRARCSKLGLVQRVNKCIQTAPGWVYIKCAMCNNMYLVKEDDSEKFTHEFCARLIPLPLGWNVY